MSERKFAGIRAKLAQEFCGFSGSLKEFKTYFPENDTLSKSAIRYYSAAEVRYARLKMTGADPAQCVRPATLPPLIYSRFSKGGTGKTTVSANVASCLASMGHRVLLIDADAQASLTGMYGIDWANEEIHHIGHLMQQCVKGEKIDMQKAIRSIYAGGMLDLIASDITLTDTDSWLITTPNREAAFQRLLEEQIAFFSQYDAIVIDSAPGTTLLSNSIMFATKTVLAVVWLDGQSLRAMQGLASNIEELNSAFGDQGFSIDVHIVANGRHNGYPQSKLAEEALRNAYPTLVDDQVIPHSQSFARQVALFENDESGPVLEREPSSVASRAIIDLTKSLIRRYRITLPTGPQVPVLNKKKRKSAVAVAPALVGA